MNNTNGNITDGLPPGNITICSGGGHSDSDDYKLVYITLALFIIPAVIEVILWVCLYKATRLSNSGTKEKHNEVSSATSKDIVTDMQDGLVRSAMFDTVGYIICWGPFNMA